MSDEDLPPFVPQADVGMQAVLSHWRKHEADHRSAILAATAGTFSAPFILSSHVPDETVLASDAVAAEAPEVAFGIAALINFRNEQNPEGQFVQGITPAWMAILDELARDSNALYRLSPRQFEELIAGAYKRMGWTVTLTPRSNDGGVDVIACRDDIGSFRVLDQVKLYKPRHLVSAEEVRAMLGVLDGDRAASKACITTTSDFAPGVYKTKQFLERMPTSLDLRNGTQLKEWLTQGYKR
jgi:restriction system protein